MYKDFFKYKIASIFFLVTMLFINGAHTGSEYFSIVYDNDEIAVHEQTTRNPFWVLKSLEEDIKKNEEEKEDKVCFNPYNRKFLFKKKYYSELFYEYEVWDLSKDVSSDDACVKVFLTDINFFDLAFSSKYPNLVAYLTIGEIDDEGTVQRYDVCIYDIERDVVKVIPLNFFPDVIQFNKDGYLMIGRGKELSYYQNGEEGEKPCMVKTFKISDFLAGEVSGNNKNEAIIFCEEYSMFGCAGQKDLYRFAIVNTQMVNQSGFPYIYMFENYSNHVVINENLIAIEERDSAQIHIFDTKTMRVKLVFKSSINLDHMEFWNESLILQHDDKIKIVNIITENERDIPIPDHYRGKSVLRTIKKERDHFILGLLTAERDRILFLDSRDDTWVEFFAEQGKIIVELVFLPDSENKDPFFNERMGYLIEMLNQFKFDESEQEAQPATEECEFGQKIFKDSIVSLDVFGTDSFPMYKSMF